MSLFWLGGKDARCASTRLWHSPKLLVSGAFVDFLRQVAVFSLSTLYMTWRAPLVEGVLDGSMDKEGVVLKPRVVEVRPCFEQAQTCSCSFMARALG